MSSRDAVEMLPDQDSVRRDIELALREATGRPDWARAKAKEAGKAVVLAAVGRLAGAKGYSMAEYQAIGRAYEGFLDYCHGRTESETAAKILHRLQKKERR